MKIGILADTHGSLDKSCLDYFQDCDEIWHAGDIGKIEIIDELQKVCSIVRVVHGNIDDQIIQRAFPENYLFKCEGLKILLIHIAGKPPYYNKTVNLLLKEENPHILVCGHSHIPRVVTDTKNNNLLYINPGAAGNEGFHNIKTIIILEITNKKITAMKLIELGKRGKIG